MRVRSAAKQGQQFVVVVERWSKRLEGTFDELHVRLDQLGIGSSTGGQHGVRG